MKIIHAVGVLVAKAPEFELEDDDAKTLAEPLSRALKFRDLGLTPEQEAWADFAEAAVVVYGSMVTTYLMRKRAEENARKPKGTVHNLHLRPVPPQTETPKQPENKGPAPIIVPDSELVAGFESPAFDPFHVEMPGKK